MGHHPNSRLDDLGHYPLIFKMLKGANSLIGDGILTKFKLIHPFYSYLSYLQE